MQVCLDAAISCPAGRSSTRCRPSRRATVAIVVKSIALAAHHQTARPGPRSAPAAARRRRPRRCRSAARHGARSPPITRPNAATKISTTVRIGHCAGGHLAGTPSCSCARAGFGQLDDVGQQERPRQRAHPAGIRRHVTGHLPHVGMHVADELAARPGSRRRRRRPRRARTMSAVTMCGTPTPATMMSACLVSAGRSRVPVWHNVTVAFSERRVSNRPSGRPTVTPRPMTTTCAPAISTSIAPQQVHDAARGARQRRGSCPAPAGPGSSGAARRRPWPDRRAPTPRSRRAACGSGSCTM